MPEWTSSTPLSAVEPALCGLLDHFCLPDELPEQLAEALEGLGADERAEQQHQQQQQALEGMGTDERAEQQQQQQQQQVLEGMVADERAKQQQQQQQALEGKVADEHAEQQQQQQALAGLGADAGQHAQRLGRARADYAQVRVGVLCCV
jgi:hypothetical protein